MAKSRRRGVSPAHGAPLAAPSANRLSFIADKTTVDPALAGLFASSLGPVKIPPKSRYQVEAKPPRDYPEPSAADDGDPDADSDGTDEANATSSDSGADSESSSGASTPGPILDNDLTEQGSRKRRRMHQREDLENAYMQRLAREEAKDENTREADRSNKRRKTTLSSADGAQNGSLNAEDDEEGEDETASIDDANMESEGSVSVHDVPQHETLATAKEETDLEKSSRTVFLGNVSTLAITSKSEKKTLLAHLSSFLPSLALDSSTIHKVESFRFRSTAFSTLAIPKKAAFVKKELMDATTKSTNAYVVYSTPLAAREAVKRLNGTIVLDRHLRVDGVAHPAKVDHKRCVFVGNLGFVDDDSLISAGEDGKKKKTKPPADMEEGLWREFGKAGIVESVRVVRDSKTRVGKGFAYVQFTDINAVEAALLYNDKKFPPMLPRKLRVTRAKHINKTASANNSAKPLASTANPPRSNNKIYNPKPDSHTQSLHGRASKLLGRAGAAKLRASARDATKERRRGASTAMKTPEMVVFEGYRAKSGARPAGMRISSGSGKKKGGKERSRRTVRAAAWKTSRGKK